MFGAMYFFKKRREEDKRMKKKVLAFLLASAMVIEPFSVVGAADFSDGTGQDVVQFSDNEDVPEVENDGDGVDQFDTDAVGEGEDFTIGNDYSNSFVSNKLNCIEFSISKPGKVTISQTIVSDVTNGNLYAGIGNETSAATSWNSLNGKIKTISTAYLSKGKHTYYFKCTGNGTYNITSSFLEVKETFLEEKGGNNNSFIDANEIKIDTDYYGLISSDDPVDVYKVEILNDGIMEINMEGYPNSAHFGYKIYDENKELVFEIPSRYYDKAYNESSNWKNIYTIKKGTYYLEIQGEGDYRFQIKNYEHSYDNEYTIDKKATCISDGYKSRHCIVDGCESFVDKTIIPALGHDWDEGIITKPATKTEEGVKTYTCRRCKETKTESIPKLSAINFTISQWDRGWNNYYQYTLYCDVDKTVKYYTVCVKAGDEIPTYDKEKQDGVISSGGTYINVSLLDEETDIYVFVTDDDGNYTYAKTTPNYSNRPHKPIYKVGKNVTASTDGDTLILTGNGETYDECSWVELNNRLDKDNIKHIVIEDGITSIGQELFSNFQYVKEVTLPHSLKKIGVWAFSDCRSLENIEIPDSVTSIGACAFSDCSVLTNLTLPDSITEIGESAFSNCVSLNKIVLPSKLTSLGEVAFGNCNAEISFPASLKYIPRLGSNAVRKVIIPEGIEILKEEAFLECKNLTEITLPSTINTIEDMAFDGTGITTFNWSQKINSIPAYAFCNTNLTDFSVPENVTEINDNAFYNCLNMTKISIPKSVTYIGTDVFKYCRNLTIYGYKDSAAESYAKANNIKFVSADYKVVFKDNGRTQKTEYVIKGENAAPPTLPVKEGYTLSWDADYTNIQEDMVINAVWIKKDNGGGNTTIIVSPSETTKYTVTFKDRGKIVKTEKVKSGDAAEYPYINRNGYELSWDKDFSKVTANITVNAVWTVIKPDKVTSLTAEVQKNSIDLSWDRAENTDYYLVYRKATSDTEYKQIKKTTKILWTDEDVEPGTEYSYKVVGVCSVDGKKYQGADSDIVTAKIGTPQIGDVYSVGDLKYKVTGAKEVSVIGLAKEEVEIKIPSAVSISGKAYKVTSVQAKAFYQNEDIVSIAIGNNVIYIGKYAFYQCPNLETVKFGKRVSVISTCAFTQCPNLENVTLPSSIRRIGAKAFYQCTSIKVLKINGSVLEYVGKKGLAVNKTVTLRLPKKVYTKYKKLIKVSGVYSKTKYTKF